MNNPKLYRKRFLPKEMVLLKDDIVVFQDSECIVTKWTVLKPRRDFSNGISYTFLNKGWKISKFLRSDGSLLYYYCDIIHTDYDIADNSYVFTDLLADVIIYGDGRIEVVDLGEMGEALACGIINKDIAIESLRRLEGLLKCLYKDGVLPLIKDYMDK